MQLRAALYARYSTDMQRDASIEDQLRLCREYAAKQSWVIVDSYSDRGTSGASLLRPGVQALIHDSNRGIFDVVLAEGLDRLSRDQADIAGLHKTLNFAGIRIYTVADGKVDEMHIGLKGTMNALFLKDLALKTHRGLRGRIEAGKSGGGNSYGYEVVKRFGPDGDPIAGERLIRPAEAAIVTRIFKEFAAGRSPRAIAHALNKEKVPGPRVGDWGQSTINGNAERGTGILNNELYVGRLVWNRLRYIKDPNTGKRVSRPNAPDGLVIKEVPDLRIIDDALWQAVKARQAVARKGVMSAPKRRRADGTVMDCPSDAAAAPSGFWTQQRPRYLLSGLMRCGACGGGYTKISDKLFGCAAARNKGTCTNRLNIRGEAIESIVFEGLKHRLMDPGVYKEFLAGFIAETNTILAHQNAHFASAKAELAKTRMKIKALVNAVAEGLPTRSATDEMQSLETREDELIAILNNPPASAPAMHPQLAEIYRERVAALHQAFEDLSTKDEAFTIIRALIEEVRLVPVDGKLQIEIRGALAGILALALNKPNTLRLTADRSMSVLVEQVKLVAGPRDRRRHIMTVDVH